MTSKERVRTVLEGGVPDRVPYHDDFWATTVQRWRGEGLPSDVTPGEHFGCDPARWSPGTRSDAWDRATAAYLARQRFGYPMGAIARALGYRGHSSVRTAVSRVESAGASVKEILARPGETPG